jgi:undecaprenyl-diphosphatase
MTLPLVILLAIVQGLTEFLPVSSSGHLRLLQAWFGVTEPQTSFDVALHLATVLSVVVVMWPDVRDLLLLRRPRLLLAVAVATAPLFVLGPTVMKWAEANLVSTTAVGLALIGNAGLLWFTRGRTNPEGHDEPTWKDALFIGVVQGLKMRGFSRSGMTISAGLFRGLKPEAAFRFSFLMSLPAVMMAASYETLKAVQSGADLITGVSLPLLATGFAVAFVTGVVALKVLRGFVVQGRLHVFAWYCLAVGVFTLATAWGGWA